MSKVDWSKAPEGAKFYSCRCFRKREGDNEFSSMGSESKWTLDTFDDMEWHKRRKDFEMRPEAVGWDGEELPPVGSVCEMTLGGAFHAEIEIIQYRRNGRQVVFWDKCKDRVDAAEIPAASFRPIKSKRDKWIESVAREAGFKNCSAAKSVAASIYDALMSGKLDKP